MPFGRPFIGFPLSLILRCWFQYASPTLDKSFTVIAITLVAGIILTPTDYRFAAITFLAGSGLGYYFEVWGTTRGSRTYYPSKPHRSLLFSHTGSPR